MPACFVPFCGSGYGNKANKSCEIRPAVFNFPKSAKARRIWLNACRRDKVKIIFDLSKCEKEEFRRRNPGMTTKDGRKIIFDPRVCQLHFAPEDLLQRVAYETLPDGTIRKSSSKKMFVRLTNKEKVVPKIFPGFPEHQFKQKEAKPPKRRARHAVSVANKSKNFSGLNVALTPVDQIQNNVEDDELQADVGLQLPLHNQEREAKPPKRRARHAIAISVANKSKSFSGLNVAPTPVDQIQNNVEDDRLQANIGLQLPLHHQEDADDDMQKESIIRPPDMLCAIYSLPDANPAELDVLDEAVSPECYLNTTQDTQVLDTTEDLDSFYSRCLLCTCRPDATPHLEIFSEAGNQLKLAEKISECLNMQIGTDLPQRVCQSCIEKLDVTHELVTSSQRARIMLIQMKQNHGEINVGLKKESVDFNNFEKGFESDSHQPTIAIDNENIITEESPTVISDSNCIAENLDQSADSLSTHTVEEPTCATVCKSNKKSSVADKSGVLGFIKKIETEGLSEEDFVKCPQCSQVIYKSYLAFHVKTIHEKVTPSVLPVDGKTRRKKQESARRQQILDPQECNFCKKQFYSQVLDIHILLRVLRHKEPSSKKIPELQETDSNCLMQCPKCPCLFFPEFMQAHIAEEHPPAPNPDLKCGIICVYCDLKISNSDMREHLDSEHGPNAWRKCIHCRKKIRDTDSDMEAHLFQEHSGGKLLVCQICDRKYAKTGKEQAHMQTFLSCKYKCPLQSCRKMFVTLASFQDHVLFFHPNIEQDMETEMKEEIDDVIETQRLFADPECWTTDEETENVKIVEKEEGLHENSVNKIPVFDTNTIEIQEIPCPLIFKPVATKACPDFGGPVKCDICNETMKHKWHLIKHKNQVHNMNLTFDCDDCWKSFPLMQRMLNHIHLCHLPKDHVCDICGEKYTKRGLTVHMKLHQNGKQPRKLLNKLLDPVCCGICNSREKSKYALVHHINSEHLNLMGEYLPYRCERCRKKFVTYKHLMRHHYTAHLPKILCPHCGEMKTWTGMRNHLKTHESARD